MLKSAGRMGCLAEKREPLAPARAVRILAGAIGPATAPRWHQDRPGAQSPRPAPAPPTAGASHPPGRALASVPPGPAGLRGTVPCGRGKRGSRLLFPPGRATASSPHQLQGPSPLPQRPAGSGAGLCFARTHRSTRHRPARGAGETRVAFPHPARTGNSLPPIGKTVPTAPAAAVPFQHPVNCHSVWPRAVFRRSGAKGWPHGGRAGHSWRAGRSGS